MKRLVIGIFAILVLASACKTDFEVNAPWKDITVVYGLLNQNDSIHYIKVNRAFLGEENAEVMALERDSSEYDTTEIDVTIEVRQNGTYLKKYTLEAIQDSNKASGTFYGPIQTLYYFVDPNLGKAGNGSDLDPAADYKLVIKKNETGEVVTSSTPLVQSFDFANKGFWNKPLSNPPKVNFYYNGFYQPFKQAKWKSAVNGRRYQLKVTFHYYEKPAGQSGPLTHKTLDWLFPIVKAPDLDGGDEIGTVIEGEDFYKYVANKLEPVSVSNNVDRCIGSLDFKVSVGGEDLNTYLDVNEPSTGIVQERPEYTNVFDGNGKEQAGIFSCNYSIIKEGAILTKEGTQSNAVTELKSGTYTIGYGFTDNSDDNTSTCPQ